MWSTINKKKATLLEILSTNTTMTCKEAILNRGINRIKDIRID